MKSLKRIAKGAIITLATIVALGGSVQSNKNKPVNINKVYLTSCIDNQICSTESKDVSQRKKSLEQISESEQWRTKKELDGLYNVLVNDIKKDKPIIFTTYIGLWGNGESPNNNLYWGKKYGHFRMFERAKNDSHIINNFKNHDWERIFYEESKNDPLRTVVYNMEVEPNNFWEEKGIKNKFNIQHVYLVYDDIREAGTDMTLHLKQDNAKIIDIGDKKIDLGKDSRIIGYNGHNFYYDGDFPELHQIKGIPKEPKAVYSIGCKTASFFNHVWIDKNIYGLLFTTSFMAPEGYNLLSLIDSVAQGKSGKEIVDNSNKAYRYFQVLGGQRKPGKLFVNHSHELFD